MASGLKVTGVRNLMKTLDAMQLNVQQASEIGVKRGLAIAQRAAQEILEREQTNNWPDHEGRMRSIREGPLYKAFRKVVIKNAGNVVAGQLVNTDPAAIWLELGTDAHPVAPIHASTLVWWDANGTHGYSRGHTVSGVTAIHFLGEALDVSAPLILEEYARIMKRGGFSGMSRPHFGSPVTDD